MYVKGDLLDVRTSQPAEQQADPWVFIKTNIHYPLMQAKLPAEHKVVKANLIYIPWQELPAAFILFVFFNRRADTVKCLYWDHTGYCLWSKWLEQGVFRLPAIRAASYTLSMHELNLLLEGIDLKVNKPFRYAWAIKGLDVSLMRNGLIVVPCAINYLILLLPYKLIKYCFTMTESVLYNPFS